MSGERISSNRLWKSWEKARCVQRNVCEINEKRGNVGRTISVYGPGMERTGEDREIIRDDLKWCIGCCEDGRVVVIGDGWR